MGLKDTFKNAAETVITAVGDVAEEAHYYQTGSSLYDVSAGIVSSIDSKYLVSGVFSHYKAMEIDNSKVLPQDIKLKLAQKNAPMIPHVKDYLQRVENEVSVRYEVVDFEQDSAGAVWVMQLRKP